jgi:serine/threonine protein kinase
MGQTVAHYRVLGGIGEGGMGEVSRATDTRLARDVALKVLAEKFSRDTDRMVRFEREARLLASLKPSQIASIYLVQFLAAPNALGSARGGTDFRPRRRGDYRSLLAACPSCAPHHPPLTRLTFDEKSTAPRGQRSEGKSYSVRRAVRDLRLCRRTLSRNRFDTTQMKEGRSRPSAADP